MRSMRWMTALGGLALAAQVQAQAPAVRVDDPWVRGTTTSQAATGAFMRLTPERGGLRLVAVSSALAGSAELREPVQDKDTLRVRSVPALELPAGRATELHPDGPHIVLNALRRPLRAGEPVPLTLTFEEAGHRRLTLDVRATVAGSGNGTGVQPPHDNVSVKPPSR